MKLRRIAAGILAAAVLATGTGLPYGDRLGLSIVSEAESELDAPTVDKPVVTNNSVFLSWSPVSGASGYAIYRYDVSKKKYVAFRITRNSYINITNLDYNTTYRFRVAAYVLKNGNKSVQKKSAAVKAVTQKLGAPHKITFEATETSITLKWDKVSGANAYRVYFYDPSAKKLTKYSDVTVAECTVTGLEKNTQYYFQVATLTKNGSYYVEQGMSFTTVTRTATGTKLNTADFTVYDGNGNKHKLLDYVGKPIIINLWATWCPLCKLELPYFEKYYKEYGSKIQFLMIDIWEEKSAQSTVKNYVSSNGYTFPVFYDYDYEADGAYGEGAIPMTVVINSNGELVDKHLGSMSEYALKALIDKIL